MNVSQLYFKPSHKHVKSQHSIKKIPSEKYDVFGLLVNRNQSWVWKLDSKHMNRLRILLLIFDVYFFVNRKRKRRANILKVGCVDRNQYGWWWCCWCFSLESLIWAVRSRATNSDRSSLLHLPSRLLKCFHRIIFRLMKHLVVCRVLSLLALFPNCDHFVMKKFDIKTFHPVSPHLTFLCL